MVGNKLHMNISFHIQEKERDVRYEKKRNSFLPFVTQKLILEHQSKPHLNLLMLLER